MESVPAFGLDKVVKVIAKETTKILPFHLGGHRSSQFFNPEEYISQKVRVISLVSVERSVLDDILAFYFVERLGKQKKQCLWFFRRTTRWQGCSSNV